MQDHLWLTLSALLVFLMQAGFLCLESGRTRSKNSINVAAKNIVDFLLSISLFWLVGFGLMFGESTLGIIGTSHFLPDTDWAPDDLCFFLFQTMFCSTAATLTSGAVAERMHFTGYIYISAVLSAVIYPVTGHWAWAGFFQDDTSGWLQQLGFIDFAGSTIVHSVGGWVALAAVLILGPRLGRFDQQVVFPQGSNLPLASLGVMLIWFGWFGFNGGSALVFDSTVPGILLNTCLAAIWGGIAVSVLQFSRQRYFDVGHMLNGIIAGLVGITASCFAVTAVEAAIIGLVSGMIVYVGTLWLERLQIDDALAVIPAHLFAGIWGTLAVALFGDPAILATGLSPLKQAGVQLTGIVVIGSYAFVVSYVALALFNRFVPLRVSQTDEIQGLNISEHHASTELIDLLSDMEKQGQAGDFTLPVKEEPFTEVGQIARKYNQVISQVNQEISARDLAIQKFQASEKRKSAILDSSMDGIITINQLGDILEFNPAAERSLGCLRKQVLGKNFIDLFVQERDREQVRNDLRFNFSHASGLVLNRRNPITLLRVSGNPFPAEITITATKLNYQRSAEYTLNVRDVTRDQKLQARLQFLAFKDPLTHLSNRTHLLRELVRPIAQAVMTGDTVAMLFLDLDKFKKINDTLGHKAGDELLCEVARRLKQVCRGDDMICRWGGDEFIVSFSGTLDEELVRERAEKILLVMRKPVKVADKQFSIATSIGVAMSPGGQVAVDQLIQQADIAMYAAKVKGRDNYQIFNPDMAEAARKSVDLERQMRQGLQLHQFSLVYQPKVYETRDRLLAMEALLRWHHPQLGSVPPSEFIPIAEESNLIVQLGEYVIVEALQQLSQWQKMGLAVVPVSINISGRHLMSEELVPFVAQQLSNFGVDGSLLEIEITEGVLIQDVGRCIDVLNQLKNLKITISVDDFGIGYSSLNYLKQLPLDILKIDQSFVDECDVNIEDAEICATVINLARGLKLAVVAEGVETPSQVQTLMDVGCHVFQGYYFYKPMAAVAATQLMQSLQAAASSESVRELYLQPV